MSIKKKKKERKRGRGETPLPLSFSVLFLFFLPVAPPEAGFAWLLCDDRIFPDTIQTTSFDVDGGSIAFAVFL